MNRKVKLWIIVLFFFVSACSGVKNNKSVISSIDLGLTNTKVDSKDGLVDEYDMRVSVTTKEGPEFKVQSLTIITPTGTSFKVMRSDKAAIDQIDPEFGIEIIRGFELKGNEGAWTLAAIANKEYELYGDGFYTFIADYEKGSDTVKLWYGEPGSNNPLPFLTNNGFTSPDLSQPLTNPITFTWKEDPEADYVSVFMAGEGEEKFDDFPATTTSFGPYVYKPGKWSFELAIGVERKGVVDGVNFTISKATVYTTEAIVIGD